MIRDREKGIIEVICKALSTYHYPPSIIQEIDIYNSFLIITYLARSPESVTPMSSVAIIVDPQCLESADEIHAKRDLLEVRREI